jgi:type II secretory pathway pseudopilin PulG
MIELLVVILIISILAALLTAAVTRGLGSGKKAQAASDISNLDMAMTNFHKDHKFYPPCYITEMSPADSQQHVRRFVIPSNIAQPEVLLLKKMFTRWNPATDASGNFTSPLEGAGTALDSNQVMVYFLGGPRALFGPSMSTATYGWQKTEPRAAVSGANTRIDPYYDFPEVRLAPEGGTHDGRFRDPWGTPYAYFTSSGNNYDPRFIFPWLTAETRTFAWSATAQQVAPATVYTPPPAGTFPDFTHLVHPFRSSNRWVNEGKVQIISAGPDLGFGAGSPITQASPLVVRDWVAGQAEYMSGAGNVGNDDLANFNAGAALGETGR